MSVSYSKQDLCDIFSSEAECFLLPDCAVRDVCIDSRDVDKDSLFFAIVGADNDGHNFIDSAITSGAVCVVLQHWNEVIDALHKQGRCSFIKVPDTLQALARMAGYRRSQLRAKVVAITGSMGKTTVRHMLQSVLSSCLSSTEVYASPHSYNNIYGLSLTLANTPIESKVVILEIGMNHAGEIDALTRIARPHIAIITCIASSHIGHLGGKDNIMRAKAEIFNGMDSSGVVILNTDDDYCIQLSELARERGIVNIFRVGGRDNAPIYIKEHSYFNLLAIYYTLMFKDSEGAYQEVPCHVNSMAYHNVVNSMFAFAVAHLFSLDLYAVAKVVANISMLENRGSMRLVSVKGKMVTVIDETFNCNCDGLRVSIENLGIIKTRFPSRRVICFLGDILELGSFSEDLHKSILPSIIAAKVDLVYTVGRYMKYLHDILPQHFVGHHFQNSRALANKICSILADGDIALFKGSHAVEMSNAVDRLYRV